MDLASLVGYVASALIALAMMMTGIVRLRVVALAGSATMMAYGVLIDAWPIIIANAFISAVHLVYLRKLLTSRVHFELQPIGHVSNWYLHRFLHFYGADIATSHPDFDIHALPEHLGFFVLRDMLSTGVFIYTQDGDALRIHLDYVTPAFRDLRNARFTYAEFDRRLAGTGARRFVVLSPTAEMASYYARNGFNPAPDLGLGALERPIAAQRTWPPSETVSRADPLH